MRLALLASIALMSAAPAVAQAPSVPAAAAPIEPARLAAAKTIAAKLLPAGTYRTMMDGTLTQMMSGMTDQMMDLPLRDIMGMTGQSEADLKKLGPATLKQVMAIVDPAFQQRTKILMDTMMPAIVDLMETMEPQVRDGLAEAYARRFSVAQLGELNRFFETPTGAQYAGQSMLVYTDPAVMSRMQAMTPELMKAMPGIIEKVKAASATLPPARTKEDLTAAEKKQLAALLGTSVE